MVPVARTNFRYPAWTFFKKQVLPLLPIFWGNLQIQLRNDPFETGSPQKSVCDTLDMALFGKLLKSPQTRLTRFQAPTCESNCSPNRLCQTAWGPNFSWERPVDWLRTGFPVCDMSQQSNWRVYPRTNHQPSFEVVSHPLLSPDSDDF